MVAIPASLVSGIFGFGFELSPPAPGAGVTMIDLCNHHERHGSYR
jgi:hypothetical protein